MDTKEVRTKKKSRGGGFPSVDLEEALKIITEGSSAGWDVSREAFAGTINSSSKSGPFLLKLATLRDFGFIERGERIQFTTLAKELIAPTSEDEEVRRVNLRKAFLNAESFRLLYEKLKERTGEPTLETIANMGMSEFSVSLTRRKSFAKNFFESGKFAGLLETTEEGRIRVKELQEGSIEQGGPIDYQQPSPSASKISAQGRKRFQFQDAGEGWELQILSGRPISVETKKKVLEIVRALDELNSGQSEEKEKKSMTEGKDTDE